MLLKYWFNTKTNKWWRWKHSWLDVSFPNLTLTFASQKTNFYRQQNKCLSKIKQLVIVIGECVAH